jgi:hypothetical protein
MRIPLSLAMCALVIAGCAGEPSTPPPPATSYVSPNGAQLQAAPTRADGTLDPKQLAEAKKAGYSLVNTNGEVLYCRTDVKLGTHIRKNTDTVCLTAQQMIAMHEQTRQSLEKFVPSRVCSGSAAC